MMGHPITWEQIGWGAFAVWGFYAAIQFLGWIGKMAHDPKCSVHHGYQVCNCGLEKYPK